MFRVWTLNSGRTLMMELKKQIVQRILDQLEVDRKLLVGAAIEAREAATHEESKAEDKYDTRGLEASYLAGAQAKRAAEIEQLMRVYESMPILEFRADDPIGMTALVEVKNLLKKTLYFIVPKGGGVSLTLGEKTIQIISPASLLGEELIGKKTGESFEVEIQKQMREYQILSVT